MGGWGLDRRCRGQLVGGPLRGGHGLRGTELVGGVPAGIRPPHEGVHLAFGGGGETATGSGPGAPEARVRGGEQPAERVQGADGHVPQV